MNTTFIECEKGEEYGAITGKQIGSRRFFLVFMGQVKDFLHCKSNKKIKRLKKEGREAEHRATVCDVKGNIFTECKRISGAGRRISGQWQRGKASRGGGKDEEVSPKKWTESCAE